MANHYPSLQQTRRTFFLTILGLAGIFSLAQAGNAQSTSLQGKIVYHGSVPPKEEIIINKDVEVCGKTRELQSIVLAEDKGLQDVIVSVGMERLDSPGKDSEPPQSITNKGCRFLTHVATATVKQKLAIQNLDPILHNTHIRTSTRAFVNVVLLPEAKDIMKRLRKPGPMIVKCNKHPFMKSFIHVFPHPYHTVTDTQGRFTIPDLPSGTYTLSLWHETLGTVRQTITIPHKNNAILNIEFPAP